MATSVAPVAVVDVGPDRLHRAHLGQQDRRGLLADARARRAGCRWRRRAARRTPGSAPPRRRTSRCSRAGLSSGEPVIPPVISRSTWVWSLMCAKTSRSEVIRTQLHPERSAQAAAEALTSSASSPGGVDGAHPERVEQGAGAVELVDERRVLLGAARPCTPGRPARARRRPVVEAEEHRVRRELVDRLQDLAQHPVQRPGRPAAAVVEPGLGPGVVVAVQQRRRVDGEQQTTVGHSRPSPTRVPAYGVAVGRQHERHVLVPAVRHRLDPAVAGIEAHLADVDGAGSGRGGRARCRRRSAGPARRSRRSARTAAAGAAASTSSIRSCLRARPSRVPIRSRSSIGPSGKSRWRRKADQERVQVPRAGGDVEERVPAAAAGPGRARRRRGTASGSGPSRRRSGAASAPTRWTPVSRMVSSTSEMTPNAASGPGTRTRDLGPVRLGQAAVRPPPARPSRPATGPSARWAAARRGSSPRRRSRPRRSRRRR